MAADEYHSLQAAPSPPRTSLSRSYRAPKVSLTLSAHPYIRVAYRVKEIAGSYAVNIVYHYVEIVRNARTIPQI